MLGSNYTVRSSTDCSFLQKSCELGARYAELEKKQIQLNLDLKLARENLKKAQEGAVGMLGEDLVYCLCPVFPSLVLTRLSSLAEKMKEALEKNDRDLAEA